jgi:hypothetical protein
MDEQREVQQIGNELEMPDLEKRVKMQQNSQQMQNLEQCQGLEAAETIRSAQQQISQHEPHRNELEIPETIFNVQQHILQNEQQLEQHRESISQQDMQQQEGRIEQHHQPKHPQRELQQAVFQNASSIVSSTAADTPSSIVSSTAADTPTSIVSSTAADTISSAQQSIYQEQQVDLPAIPETPKKQQQQSSMLETPKKLSSTEICCGIDHEEDESDGNICSVCLSPFKEGDTRSPNVTTKCNHNFHGRCLQQARRYRASCPNCRCALTPDHHDMSRSRSGSGNTTGYDQSELMRNDITTAVSRARNAVRLAHLRREQQAALAALDQQPTATLQPSTVV